MYNYKNRVLACFQTRPGPSDIVSEIPSDSESLRKLINPY